MILNIFSKVAPKRGILKISSIAKDPAKQFDDQSVIIEDDTRNVVDNSESNTSSGLMISNVTSLVVNNLMKGTFNNT